MGWVVKTSPRACESVVLRARLSKCLWRRKSAPAGSPRSRRPACSPKACAMARGSRCAGFDSGRGRFAAPLFLNGFVVPLKGSFPLKRRSCYQGRTQHSGYSPGMSKQDANPYVDWVLPTGLGDFRNYLVVAAADAVIALEGRFGTLSEIAMALTLGKCVVGFGTWGIEGVRVVGSAEDAVRVAVEAARSIGI